MTVPEPELWAMLRQARQLSLGPARFAALDAVFRHADASQNERFAFSARLDAVKDFYYGGDPTRAYLAFSWCLAAYDRDPSLAQRWQVRTLLWRFKWIVWTLPHFPGIPLDRTRSVLDDMQHRYEITGHSLHPVYQHRWLVEHHLGDFDAAQHWYEQMLRTRRDGLSDCSACIPSTYARHLSSLGRWAEAIQVGAPYVQGGCDEQPHWILTELLLPYLQVGSHDEAVRAHHTAYPRMRNDRHHLDNIAAHVLFCALTGNEPRGLELIERHLSWLERPATPFAALEFASAAARVLDGLRARGRGDLPVRRRSEDGTRTWETSVDDLYAELAGMAREIAHRFDARNANTHQTQRVERRLSLPAIVENLPLKRLTERAD